MFARVRRYDGVVLQVADQPFQLMSGGPEFQLRCAGSITPGMVWNGQAFSPRPWATIEQISANNAAAVIRRRAAAMRAKGDDVGALTLLLTKGLQP